MSASVRIEAKAYTDPNFGILAGILGLADNLHALIKVSQIWAWQTEEYSPDEPTYVVPVEIVEHFLGRGAGEALVRSRLAYSEPTGFRMRGSEGRIEWLWAKRENGKRGGRPRQSARQRNEDNNPEPTGLDSVDLSQTYCEPTSNPLSLAPSPTPTNQKRAETPLPPLPKPRRSRSKSAHSDTDRAAAMAVLRKLGEQNGTEYEGAENHVRLIVGRYREGRTELDLRKIIAYASRDESEDGLGWLSNPKMRKHLKPEVLFGPENITRYVDDARSWFKRKFDDRDIAPSPEYLAWFEAENPQPRLAVVK